MTYNKKLSGAKAVLVPINRIGNNPLPFIEDLRDRYVKYIDFYPVQYLPGTDKTGCTVSANMYFTIADVTGNGYLVKDMPLQRFDYTATTGARQPVFAKISLQNSVIVCQNQSAVNTVALLIFWYDLPEFSRQNKTDLTITDSLTVPLTSSIRHNTLPDEERMALRRFRRIFLGTPSVTPDYGTGLTENQLKNIYITLRKGTYNVVDNLPVWLLYQLKMIEKTEFANIIFDFQSSFLSIGGDGTIPNVDTEYVGKNVFLNLVYEK